MRVLPFALILLVAAIACSDRVPAPTTPTPSPRPGYPPAPSSELPEGVLFLEGDSSGQQMVFGIGPDGEARAYELSMSAVSPDGSRALTARSQTGEVISPFQSQTGGETSLLGVMTGSIYEEISNASGTAETAIWSNDGKRLAYTRQNDSAVGDNLDVWTLDADTGATRQLTTEANDYSLLGWTATGEVLVSTSQGLAILGKTQRVVRLPEAVEVVYAVLSPDGSRLSVLLGEITEGEQDGWTQIRSSGIWVFDITRGAWRELLDLPDEPAGAALTAWQTMGWSPDGRRMTVHGSRMDDGGVVADSLIVLDVETGKETLVHEQQGWGGESWSPDGRYLAYWYEGNAELGQGGSRLGILRPDGRKRDVKAYVRGMAWTGDGRLLLDIPLRLSLLDPETMRMERVVTDEGRSIIPQIESAVWSPDGRYVAVSTPWDGYHRASLYIIDTEEGTAELFLDEAGFSAVAWLRE